MKIYNIIMEAKHILHLYVQSQKAEAIPPLGTVLGNLGVNVSNFCKDFNNYTSELPSYYILGVKIFIYGNRTYKFFIKEPSLGSIVNLLAFYREYKKQNTTISYRVIRLKDIVEL